MIDPAAVLATAATETERLLLALGLVFLLGPLIAGRLRLPGLIGLVIGGTLLGAEGLAVFQEGELEGLGDIGLLYLMFTAGLELDLPTLQRYRRAAVGFGVVTFLFPFLLGTVAGLLLDYEAAAAVLIGSIWASHTLVAYPEARAAGLATNRAVTTAVGATALTDTLALVVLAVIAASQEGGSPATTVVKVGVGLALLAGYCLVALPRVARWLFARVLTDRASRWVALVVAFTSAAVLAERFAIEGLVGAFFAGVGVNRLVPNSGGLMERVEFFGSAFFVPTFLVYVGTRIDPEALLEAATWRSAGLFLCALVVGKAVAAGLAGRRLHFSPSEIGLMFSLTLAQAAATLAATLVGEEIGLFDADVVNAVVVVVLLSILLASIGTASFARRVEAPDVDLAPIGTRVVVGLPADGGADRLLDLAGDLAVASGGSVVAVATAAANDLAGARAGVAEAVERLTRRGADAEGIPRLAPSLAGGLLDSTVEIGGSMILMQWEPRSRVSELLTPSDVDRVGLGSSVPVAAARLAEDPPTRVVLGLAHDVAGDLVDGRLALGFSQLASTGAGLPLVVLTEAGSDPSALELPESLRPVEVGPDDLAEQLRPGDLIVVPVSRARTAIGAVGDAVEATVAGLSLVVVGSPGRLAFSPAAYLTGGGVRRGATA